MWSWIEAIRTAFGTAQITSRERLVDLSFLLSKMPRTVSERQAVSSSAALNNLSAAFKKITKPQTTTCGGYNMRTQVTVTLDFDSDQVEYEDVVDYLNELIEDESLSYEVSPVLPFSTTHSDDDVLDDLPVSSTRCGPFHAALCSRVPLTRITSSEQHQTALEMIQTLGLLVEEGSLLDSQEQDSILYLQVLGDLAAEFEKTIYKPSTET